ncbi:MAG: hypothetical protein HY007_02455 [Candidatus Sungbacteria bacterium]|nr:hypothetical protein [Candidatus Sungbacteria bacterium]
MKECLDKFWAWYDRHYIINVGITTGLFLLQTIHLIWLFGDAIVPRLFGVSLFGASGVLKWGLIVVDYTEIPALLSVSLVYWRELKRGFSWRSIWYLAALQIQWVHLFWITDEFVIGARAFQSVTFAWIAILIDYLEVPVMITTVRTFIRALRNS